MKVAFHIYHFSFRGTEVAAYDYAHYNETICKNKSIIVCPENHELNSNPLAKTKFSSRFDIFYYSSMKQLEEICDREGVDVLYVIKYGKRDDIVLKNIKTVSHCVFTTEEPHGDVYAGVSDSVAQNNHFKIKYPRVNHIVWLPELTTNYRDELGIPKDDIVFGRHGGSDTFNIPAVAETIKKLLNDKNNVWFLFAERPQIFNDYKHPRLVCAEPFADVRVKRKFINTCDAMIHASMLGESFGLSVMEFTYCNKPVITWCGGLWHKQHLETLGDRAIQYETPEELYTILYEFTRENIAGKDYKSAVAHFSPEVVMDEFKRVFLS